MPTATQDLPLLDGQDRQPRKPASKWLLRYILSVACLAFTGRAAPLSFLPLELQESFDQSSRVIGIVMAIYPFFALMTTPFAARLSRRSKRIVTLHSFAIIAVAFAMFLTSFARVVQDRFGNTAGVAWVALGRAVQGFGASLYLSSNTCLITRKFPDRLPYVIAITEVAVGAGGQVGRMVGGFLYDFGGFPLPFVAIGIVQGFVGIIGFGFEDAEEDKAASKGSTAETTGNNTRQQERRHESIPWGELATPRLCTGALAAFMMYFVGTFGEATLLQYLVVHLAPVTIGTLSVGMSSRGLSYLLSSFGIAQMMHGELVSFERLISIGALCGIFGQIIMAPQLFVTSFETWLSGGTLPMSVVWFTVILSFVFSSLGNALMFVPSLPLMQSEVQVRGNEAVEQVAELFVTMMTLGEMLGPIFGGWLVGRIGFVHGSFVLSMTLVPILLLSLATYDRQALRARRGMRKHELVAPVLDPGQEDGLCGAGCGAGCVPFVPSDGEASFAWRRMPFAIDVRRELGDVATSAPSSVFRRAYGERGGGGAQVERGSMSVPAESFRRAYVPPGSGV